MAKKKVIQDGIVEETTVDTADIADVVEAPIIPREEDEGVMIEHLTPLTVDISVADDPELNVRITLPRGALMALIDMTHPEANPVLAIHYGLLASGAPTASSTLVLSPIGEKVLAGCDQTALRHQMATAWRTAYNVALEPSKMKKV